MMRVLVCGSRGFEDTVLMRAVFENMLKGFAEFSNQPPAIVEGCARGADRLAEQVAGEFDLEVDHFPADWNRWGRGAGYKRNIQMLDSGITVVLAFWDGVSKGTKHTIDQAKARGIPVEVWA